MIRFGAKARLFDEFLYAQAGEEVSSGAIRPGLWAKALADAMGDDTKAKAIYIKLRVESLKDEASVIAEFERTQATKAKAVDRADSAKVANDWKLSPTQRAIRNENRMFVTIAVLLLVLILLGLWAALPS